MTPRTPTDRPPRRRGSLRWVLLALVLLPFLEIAVLVLVGQAIGFWPTLALLIGLAVVGAWLARRETGRTYRALQKAVELGRMPADEVTDAILIMVGGFLLILPGFVSDLVGLVLVLPFTRPLARRLLQLVVAQQAVATVGGVGSGPRAGTRPGPARQPGRGQVIEGEVVSESPAPGTADQARPRLEP